MGYLVIIGDITGWKPFPTLYTWFGTSVFLLYRLCDRFSASSLFRPRRRFAAPAGFLHSEGGRKTVASTRTAFGMWHLHQSVARLDAGSPQFHASV
ncbi:MAG: hypothetical protein ACKO9H_15755, partial [Planctomycetota bacterium]